MRAFIAVVRQDLLVGVVGANVMRDFGLDQVVQIKPLSGDHPYARKEQGAAPSLGPSAD